MTFFRNSVIEHHSINFMVNVLHQWQDNNNNNNNNSNNNNNDNNNNNNSNVHSNIIIH